MDFKYILLLLLSLPTSSGNGHVSITSQMLQLANKDSTCLTLLKLKPGISGLYPTKVCTIVDQSKFLKNSLNLTTKKALSTCVARYGKALGYRLAVMRSNPATGHIRYALLINQPK